MLGEGMTFSSEEKEAATKYEITNNHIYYGSVGGVQNGNDNTIKVEQTINSNNAELLQVLTDLRRQVESLSSDRQSIANEAIETLQETASNPTLLNKAQTALFTLWGVGQEVATFTNAVTAVAERLGVHLH
jgi:hypothetical protein